MTEDNQNQSELKQKIQDLIDNLREGELVDWKEAKSAMIHSRGTFMQNKQSGKAVSMIPDADRPSINIFHVQKVEKEGKEYMKLDSYRGHYVDKENSIQLHAMIERVRTNRDNSQGYEEKENLQYIG